MTPAYRCEACGGSPAWRIERYGDAVVTWACRRHLGETCEGLQRAWEQTRLAVLRCTIGGAT